MVIARIIGLGHEFESQLDHKKEKTIRGSLLV